MMTTKKIVVKTAIFLFLWGIEIQIICPIPAL